MAPVVSEASIGSFLGCFGRTIDEVDETCLHSLPEGGTVVCQVLCLGMHLYEYRSSFRLLMILRSSDYELVDSSSTSYDAAAKLREFCTM